MDIRRREFVRTALAGGALLSVGGEAGAAAGAAALEAGSGAHARRALRVLILGGTGFIGPHLVRLLVERGHAVTIFTRGRRKPALFQEAFTRVESLTGDRSAPDGLAALRGRTWDVVFDDSGSRVEWTRASAQLLKGVAGQYVYISSTGVFYPYLRTDIDETVQPLLADPEPEEQPSYGVMKALSEREAEAAFPGRALIVRPHFIVGPGDTSDRYPYWPVRLERGGEVLVPGRRTDPVQLIDVRDLTGWMVRMVEAGENGVYNLAGPESRLSMAEFVYGTHASIASPVTYTWIEDYDFLESYPLRRGADGRTSGLSGAVPWILLRGDNLGMTTIRIERALGKGLVFRPLAETTRDTLAWWYSPAVPDARRAAPRFVLTADQEAAMLAAWKARPG